MSFAYDLLRCMTVIIEQNVIISKFSKDNKCNCLTSLVRFCKSAGMMIAMEKYTIYETRVARVYIKNTEPKYQASSEHNQC